MTNGYELIDNFLTKDEHEYYLNVCKKHMKVLTVNNIHISRGMVKTISIR